MRLRRAAAALVLLAGVALLPAGPVRAADTSSAVTVSGAGDFAGLQVTVSQTADLVNQAVTVTWTGGTPTPRDRLLGVDYLQVMQCWGDPAAAGDPDGLRLRETCQFGVELKVPRLNQGGDNSPASIDANTRRRYAMAVTGYPADDPAETLPRDAEIVPFRAVNGEVTPHGGAAAPFPVIRNPAPPFDERQATAVQVLAPFFDPNTTNEYPFALTGADGTGRLAFEVQNATRAPHLGCGAEYTDAQGRTQPSRPCTLVILPRGHKNPYDGSDVSTGAGAAVHGSPFVPAVWKNRITVPLNFDAVGGFCSRDRDQRGTAGTELVAEAVTSWQPALCAGDGPVFAYASVGDFEAGRQVLNPSAGAPGLVFTAEPVVAGAGDAPVVHAPIALSAVVLALNIDANIMDRSQGTVPPEVEAQRGLAVSGLKLTPRLVAKLLTQSYRRDIAGNGGSPEMADNPESLRYDQEFLDLNPIFASWDRTRSATLDGLMVSVGSSASAREVWRWILADPAARAWAEGAPDEQKMVINPQYRTLPSATLDSFPKADRTCVPGPAPYVDVRLCTLDYRPYLNSFQDAALQTLRAHEKTANLPLDVINVPPGDKPKFTAVPRKEPGFRFSMSITDSASAARYGLFTADLCRAERGADGKFAAADCRQADAAGIQQAAGTLVPSAVAGVRVNDPATSWNTPGAYPLTMVSYAVGDTGEAAEARKDYAAFLRYAVGNGQQPGAARGSLPEGYVPLPEAMRVQARTAADALQNAVAPTTPPPDDDQTGTDVVPPPAANQPAPTNSVPPAGPPPSVAPVPSPGNTAPSQQPPAVAVALATPANPLGVIRWVLAAALAAGLIGGVAGPILRRLAQRTDSPS